MTASKQILISRVKEDESRIRISSMLDKELEYDLTISPSDSIVGNIYVGRVENIIDNLGAAFVRFKNDAPDARDNTGYLPLKDIDPNVVYSSHNDNKSMLRGGDLILVQVSKAPIKTKQAVLSGCISISGKYTVLSLGRKGIGCSRKIDKKLRRELIARFSHDFTFRSLADQGYGCLIRTRAADCISNDDAFAEARREIMEQVAALEEIIDSGRMRTAGSLIYEGSAGRDLLEAIVSSAGCLDTLSPEGRCELISSDRELMGMVCSLDLEEYNIDIRPFEKSLGKAELVFGLLGKLEHCSSKKVWLGSGGYLVIESTEAMHVIDVNSGSSGALKGNLFLNINIEAAIEAIRQIRVRGFKGMILIDFINMASREEYVELEKVIKRECKADPVKCTFIDFTGLGIAELVRRKS
ncbi:ribonuclease E/G [Butyrivibrio sp. MC2013]|uniref:ribonuclease E/G n=1 Tax=Butyrivibrio sp. MC2013 TaxID=1280686 RepID=UPI00040CCC2C|nr:ribonuclease E/G [Butyrivibrio sp. MC2013]